MIHVFIGTKAQLIKMAPIMRELDERGIDFNYISSGQHNDTVDDLIECFDIKSPDVVLYSGRDITGIVQMLSWAARIVFGAVTRRREIFRQDTNAVVLNHGDTFSTLLGSV
ncbi:MAG: hypothetical protein K0U93_04955, partial [Gammaproteobacteria bacterium]|nr:hypothetical protein [Gammaproteobacteria bacterium]